MPDEYVRALLDWLSLENAEDGYIPGEEAIREAGAVLTTALKAQGQKELPLPD